MKHAKNNPLERAYHPCGAKENRVEPPQGRESNREAANVPAARGKRTWRAGQSGEGCPDAVTALRWALSGGPEGAEPWQGA